MTNYKQVNVLTSNDAAYIAGLIDGEGTITLSKRHRNENRQLVISISNNEKELLNYILEVIGAGSLSKKRTYSQNHSVNFREALNKSIQDFSELVKAKCDFVFTHKTKYLLYLVLAAHPCTAGTTDLIRGSLAIK